MLTAAPYTQEIQQLPYQHIIKWLPSKLRTKDPGPDDCFDVQVETTLGKKDLRMRCADPDTVQTVISDIRTTVQVRHIKSMQHVQRVATPKPILHQQQALISSASTNMSELGTCMFVTCLCY
jgi:hypothetical protein